MEQGKNLQKKHRNPTHGIWKHYEEKSVGNGDIHVNVAPYFWGLQSCLLYGTEHADIGEDYNNKGDQVNTY